MKDREALNKKLRETFVEKLDDKKWAQELTEKLNVDYNVPLGLANEVTTLRIDIENISDYEASFFARAIAYEKLFEKYYTDSEIKQWGKGKYKTKKFSFPIRWKMWQVRDDQWLGTISVEEIVELRNAQLINYDENQQRTMRRIEKGENVYYQIDVDHKQVSAIEESFESDAYIPNTITLNLPETADYYYDEKTNELVITDLDMFNIIDGYHRYLAISNLITKNPKWDYQMELRVVAFSQNKAQQFIWQEDQKHKMRKIDSDSLNQYSIATKIVNALNSMTGFDLAGEINRNSGIINSAEMVGVVDAIFVSNKLNLSRAKKKEIELSTRDLLKNRLNAMVENDYSILNNKWDYKYIVCAIFICSEESIANADINSEVQKLYDRTNQSDCDHLYKLKPFSKINYNRLKKLYESEVKSHV